MIIISVLLIIAITLIPGYWMLTLLRIKSDNKINNWLYIIGLGLLFNIAVGVITNFTNGFNQPYVVWILVMLGLMIVWTFWGDKSIDGLIGKLSKWDYIIPLLIYLVAVGLQYQTTLVSSNLVGSDIHLEYYYANLVVETGYWDYSLIKTTVNSSLGVTILFPWYSLMAHMELMMVFKVVAPLIFAVLPVALYQIFKSQFGIVVSILAVLFFVTMPMFTMDMTQLIRQQHSELFFILVVLMLLDGNLTFVKKVVLGVLFGIGVVVSHHGFAIGAIGYLAVGAVIVVVIGIISKFKNRKIKRSASIMMILFVILGFMFNMYYDNVGGGEALAMASIPKQVVERTTQEAQSGIDDTPMESITGVIDLSKPPEKGYLSEAPPRNAEDELPSIIKRFPFLNPFWREPLLQMAIGLDFGRASILGKVWRILQYIVEVCFVIGLFVFIRNKTIDVIFKALVLASVLIVGGMYLLSTYSYGMGASRIFQITLMFMSPLFVLGIAKAGGLLFKKTISNKLVILSTLVLLVPYLMFNSGVVFEIAKMENKGFVDVPYSIMLSGIRVDLSTVFDKEDVEAVKWLGQNKDENYIMYADTHGVRLLIQKFGVLMNPSGTLKTGSIRPIENMEGSGYIFLRKRNVDRNIITTQAEYGSRISQDISYFENVNKLVASGEIVFDNGARILKVHDVN